MAYLLILCLTPLVKLFVADLGEHLAEYLRRMFDHDSALIAILVRVPFCLVISRLKE
jgi:hypothetical protein